MNIILTGAWRPLWRPNITFCSFGARGNCIACTGVTVSTFTLRRKGSKMLLFWTTKKITDVQYQVSNLVYEKMKYKRKQVFTLSHDLSFIVYWKWLWVSLLCPERVFSQSEDQFPIPTLWRKTTTNKSRILIPANTFPENFTANCSWIMLWLPLWLSF